SSLEELHLEIGEFKLVVRKRGGRPDDQIAGGAARELSPAAARPEPLPTASPAGRPSPRVQRDGMIEVRAPMVGTFYRAPAPGAAESYLSGPSILACALGTRADAVHPGYGFLAENADFAAACADAGLVFVGPSPAVIRAMGDKLRAREVAAAVGVPVVPGSRGTLDSLADAEEAGRRLGYPLLLKAAAGGGGRGMRVIRVVAELAEAFAAAGAEAHAAFGDGRLYAERLLERVRHVEVQVLGDRDGRCLALGERDCSIQRRRQKLLEEAPSPAVTPDVRRAMSEAAVALTRHIRYEGAGTVEFVLEPEGGRFHFIEMNTRIQVEHPVTEMLTGVDL